MKDINIAGMEVCFIKADVDVFKDEELGVVAYAKPQNIIDDEGTHSALYCEIHVGNSKADDQDIFNHEIIRDVKNYYRKVWSSEGLPVIFHSEISEHDLATATVSGGILNLDEKVGYTPDIEFSRGLLSTGMTTTVRDNKHGVSIDYNEDKESIDYRVQGNPDEATVKSVKDRLLHLATRYSLDCRKENAVHAISPERPSR